MLRKRGSLEQMWIADDKLHPLVVVTMLNITGDLSANLLKEGLKCLHDVYRLLNVAISKQSHGMIFDQQVYTSIPLTVIPRENDDQWLEVANKELNTRFVVEQTPLMQVAYPYSTQHSESILTCHHTIVDGLSMAH